MMLGSQTPKQLIQGSTLIPPSTISTISNQPFLKCKSATISQSFYQEQQDFPIKVLFLRHLCHRVRNLLMPAAVDSRTPTLSSSRAGRRRRPYSSREHAVNDPAARGWAGQRAPLGGAADTSRGDATSTTTPGNNGGQRHDNIQTGPTSTSPLQPEDTFPGICDDHPPVDDLSTIALSPLEEVTAITAHQQQQPQPMETDSAFRTDVLPLPGSAMAAMYSALSTSVSIKSGRGPRPMPVSSTGVRPLPHALSLDAMHPIPSEPTSMGLIGTQDIVMKQEIPSPTDYAVVGSSAASAATPSGSGSGGSWAARTSGTPSPSSPVIPLTALELLNKDSSSSASDGEQATAQEQGAASAATGSGGKTKRASTSGKMLDRRKGSDDIDEDSDDEDVYDLTPDEKGRLDRRRLSNRVAAQKCRQRQRQHYRGLMKEIQDWECKNTGLNYEVRQLQKTLRQMLDEVKAHGSQCSTGSTVLTPDEIQAYQKLIDDVTATQGQSNDSTKHSK